ncbi:hypothetical protein E3_1175 [Rhodococcus phage E3]|uniref:hypothetical protein n=1 Tax=Rhodococcus phage E3 TaxID=1007869 RepID=UPI0002C6D1ED|nr:hypothetical protein M176_gp123 [Rhodococcus phage E3]AEQ21031.1 hypothetical protein E3_1175 [Rhodococcus phage E3]
MAQYASNTPVSRPVDTGYQSEADLGGLHWNSKIGLFYATPDEMLPIRPPQGL